ncbi:MAG: hypothetical protein DRG63_02435 [Deltaproteobacteria bacterium]|nr:MAG: hypothetical protein DRG63_02435 [Deltaproteobacteria bacterium]
MGLSTIEKQINDQVSGLSLEKQQQVLKFIQSLAKEEIVGVPGNSLIGFAGTIDPGELKVIEKSIEDACERVDLNEW